MEINQSLPSYLPNIFNKLRYIVSSIWRWQKRYWMHRKISQRLLDARKCKKTIRWDFVSPQLQVFAWVPKVWKPKYQRKMKVIFIPLSIRELWESFGNLHFKEMNANFRKTSMMSADISWHTVECLPLFIQDSFRISNAKRHSNSFQNGESFNILWFLAAENLDAFVVVVFWSEHKCGWTKEWRHSFSSYDKPHKWPFV